LRAFDRETALEILRCIDRYLESHNGDVKKLRPPMAGFRLRCGDYRIFFRQLSEQAIAITGVLHRRDAYR
jgi:mRNA-degrading endonuclease RelE of RelBE toxin-antitoxin system